MLDIVAKWQKRQKNIFKEIQKDQKEVELLIQVIEIIITQREVGLQILVIIGIMMSQINDPSAVGTREFADAVIRRMQLNKQ